MGLALRSLVRWRSGADGERGRTGQTRDRPGRAHRLFCPSDTISWAVPVQTVLGSSRQAGTRPLSSGCCPGRADHILYPSDEVRWAASSPDGARILTASRDKTAKLWDVALGRLIASFAHQDGVSAAAFSPDGARILTGSADNTAKLWDVASVNLIASFAHQGTVKAVAFSPDGARI